MTEIQKLQSALIEIGKHVESISNAPTIENMNSSFEGFKNSIYSDDILRMRYYGMQITAMVTKFMIEKL